MFFLFKYTLTLAVMTNFEFCRDSIHSKTTESCLLLFLCTLGVTEVGPKMFVRSDLWDLRIVHESTMLAGIVPFR